PQRLRHHRRRLHLLEAELGMAPDPLPDADDGVATTVDGLIHALLQLLLGHAVRSSRNRSGRKSSMASDGRPSRIHAVIRRAVMGASRMPLRKWAVATTRSFTPAQAPPLAPPPPPHSRTPPP